MWFQLLLVHAPLLFSASAAQQDLQIVGSDNHYVYGHVGRESNEDANGQAYQPAEDYGRSKHTEAGDDVPAINFPVKTVQKFTDEEGNVKIVTSYSNRDDNPVPMYRDAALRQNRLIQRPYIPVVEPVVNVIPKTAPIFITTAIPRYSAHREPQARPTKQQYSSTKTVKLPQKDGNLFANEHESSASDGTSSSYNQKSSYKTNYKKPPSQSSSTKSGFTSNNAPLQEAGSSYVSDVDDGTVEDEGNQFGNGEGYAEGGSSYSSGGAEHSDYETQNGPKVYESNDDGGFNIETQGGDSGIEHHGHGHGHSFKKGHGSKHHHGGKAEKGDKGGKGFKSHEKYEKGHDESHGHEEQKGGKKEEVGQKAGHLDEGTQYAKGHSESQNSKGSKDGHSKGHKKGHKTKGFRTVHHKDEYKKDEEFYDEEHDVGHKKGEGQAHASHKNAKGGSHKKGHVDSGYKHAHKGFKGDNEKGHSYKNAKGHKGNHGSSQHGSHHSHYGQAEGHKGAEAHGHEHHGKEH